MVGWWEKNDWSFLSSERAKIPALKKVVGGKNDGLRGERNSGRMVEITLSQKEKYPSARMKQSVMVLKSLKSFHKYA